MHRRTPLLGLFGFALLSCGGEETIANAELGEICGEPSPFRVLALAPNEQLLLGDRPIAVGERVLYVVSRDIDSEAPLFPTAASTSVWSTGRCGEAPLEIATDIDRLFTVDAWPGAVLGCRHATRDVFVLDPTGTRAPQPVLTDAAKACGLRWTAHGVVHVDRHDEEFGALLLHPYAADPWDEAPPPIVLADPIRTAPAPSATSGAGIIGGVLRAFDDHVLAITPDNTLIRVDLANPSIVDLRAGVAVMETSRSGRYVLWQDDTITLADEAYPEGEIRLADLTGAAADALLAQTALAYSFFPMIWADEGVVALRDADRTTERLFLLPDLEVLEASSDRSLAAYLDGDRWLTSSWSSGLYDLVDLRAEESRSLFPRSGALTALASESVDLLEVPPCCIDGDLGDEGPLWRVPLDDGEPVQRAPRATRMLQTLSDGRLVTPVSLDAQRLGILILVDPETGVEAQIDDHVAGFSLDSAREADEGIISYSVADGDRSGVYLARLPPLPSDRVLARGPSFGARARILDLLAGPDGRTTLAPRDLVDGPLRAPGQAE